MDSMAPQSGFQRLKEEQQAYLLNCDTNIKQWESFKSDYIKLKDCMETLPNELQYEAMIPISKVAFMSGKIVKTNEILVLLGDNWFTERSAHQASQVVDRRLKGIDEHLEKLNKEKKIFSDQLNWTDNVISERKDFVDIQEKYDEAEKDAKKKILNVQEKQEQRLKLQEKARQAQIKINERMRLDREAVLHKTEPQEKQDEEEEEEVEAEEDVESVDEDEDEDSRKERKSVRWTDECEDETATESDESEDSDEEEASKPYFIHFKHSQTKEELVKKNDGITVETPADIYRLFNKPKSIIKNLEAYDQAASVIEEPSERDETPRLPFEPEKAFSGQVVERQVSEAQQVVAPQTTTEPTKRISKFRQSKQQ